MLVKCPRVTISDPETVILLMAHYTRMLSNRIPPYHFV